MRREKKYNVLCPVCGEYGFLTKRWVESSYYPMYASYDILFGTGFAIRGSRYRGESKKCVIDYSSQFEEKDNTTIEDRKRLYRVTYGRYNHYYIGHYSSEKYHQQMQDYKMHKRKSRPNGRKWCHLQSDSYLYKNEPSRELYLDSLQKDCYIAYCDVRKHKKSFLFFDKG